MFEECKNKTVSCVYANDTVLFLHSELDVFYPALYHIFIFLQILGLRVRLLDYACYTDYILQQTTHTALCYAQYSQTSYTETTKPNPRNRLDRYAA